LTQAGLTVGDVDAEALRRVRVVSVATLALVALAVPTAVMFFALGAHWMAVAVAATCAVCLANLLVLHWTRRPLLAGHIGTAGFYALLVLANLEASSFYSPNFAWFALVPVLAAVVVNLRGAWVWLAVVAITTLVYWGVDLSAVPFPEPLVGDARSYQLLYSRVAAMLVLGALASTFLVVEQRAVRELAATNALLAQETGELRAAQQTINSLAYYDELTGLPNRAHFRERLAEALAFADRHDRQLAVLFLDLDGFKGVNDALGHAVGDGLLKAVAERLSSCLRGEDLVARSKEDTDIARLGGDEFTVVLTEMTGPSAAALVATRLADELAGAFQVGQNEIFVAASVGIAVFPHDGDDADTLLRHADIAMYHAKSRADLSFAFFAPEMTDATARKLLLGRRLRRAEFGAQLRVVYQPFIDTDTGQLTGAEALLRWDDSVLGSVSPDEFISVADDNGLLVEIGRRVLQTALADVLTWRNETGLPLRVAVNVSPRQLGASDVVAVVKAALHAAGVVPAALELEVTESAIIERTNAVAGNTRALGDMGVRLALDDFGTGFSSLSHLQKFPIHRLKIDRSFVSECAVNGDDAKLTAAVIALAQGLGLSIIAEGVEREDQKAFLVEHGCTEMQGFLFSRPVAAAEMLALARRHGAVARA
jgi:diguanylate cyclase (GGDEF)-like protein